MTSRINPASRSRTKAGRSQIESSRAAVGAERSTANGSNAAIGIVRRAGTSIFVIVIVALVLRFVAAWDYTQQNSHQALAVVPFLQEAGNIAISLASGHGFSSPFRVDTGATTWMTPVYPWLLSRIFLVFGLRTYASFVAAVVLNIVCSALTCIPIFFAGKRIAGLGVAAGAALLWAIFPNTILNTFQSMWDASLGTLLAATILWATLALEDSQRARDWCAYGVLWGLALMTNATLVALLPLLLGWLTYRRWSKKSAANREPDAFRFAHRKPFLAAAVALLCCVPWTIRNYVVFHRFVPFRSVLGLQIWLGNNENAQETWMGQRHPIFDSSERARYIQLGEIDYMDEKQREAIRYMATHPKHEAELIWGRFVSTWSGGTPHPITDFMHTHALWFRYVLLFNLFVAVGAIAGIAELYRKRNPYLFPIAIIPILLPWAYYLTLAYPRYRLPADPAVLLLTAVALAALINARNANFAAK
ncbi:MAG TPA: glycosyltransferase family 39 protein [Terriglobales bacterium]|nr:glycosyltransferase family 39 protein [Terriglobales bacterium]